MVEGALFIGAVIIAVTQAIKFLVPQINGAVTIGIAALVGVVVAAIDTQIGVADMTIAQGLMTGLAASGVTTVAQKVNTPTVTKYER